MAYQLTVKQEPGYLHAIITGTNDAETVARYLEELRRECIARQCFRLLIEERLEGPRLGTFPVYKVASEGSERARGLLRAIAYVDVHAEGQLMAICRDRGGQSRPADGGVSDASSRRASGWLQSLAADQPPAAM